MKSKLKKITIDKKKYLYSIATKYEAETKRNNLTIKVFLSGQKSTPLTVSFLTSDNFLLGHPLKTGITLKNKIENAATRINLNEPKYIRQIILGGLESGWTGTNKIADQNGLTYLENWGFDISVLFLE